MDIALRRNQTTGGILDLLAQPTQLGSGNLLRDSLDERQDATGRDAGLVYTSHGEQIARKPPLDVEREILDQLRAEFGKTPGVRILDTLGAPIGASLFWCNRCDFFVAPWGAGLAKYRWICNRPGLILMGPTFAKHSSDVHLYDSDIFMQKPTPVKFNAPEDAQDAPDDSLIIGLADTHRQNYYLDAERILPLIDELLKETIDRPTKPRKEGLLRRLLGKGPRS